ncbi:MAG TPA: response regulator transcription factor [Polyangiaceae bacterium]|nr:response regulator transcription factor [Polyangiaceae bacterium]
MPRVLLVDDDAALLDVLTLAFSDAGHEVSTAKDGREALATLTREPPHLLVTDVNLPHLDGYSLVRELRARGSKLPVVLLTSRDTEVDEILGFDLGADDFVSKPFSTRALLARVAALLRREAAREDGPQAQAASAGKTALVCGDLTLDTERVEARHRGTALTVTMTEFRLLEAFVRRPGVVLSRTRLLELARGDDGVVDDRLVDTYVRRIRRKLEAIEPGFSGIETVIGAGYRLRA